MLLTKEKRTLDAYLHRVILQLAHQQLAGGALQSVDCPEARRRLALHLGACLDHVPRQDYLDVRQDVTFDLLTLQNHLRRWLMIRTDSTKVTLENSGSKSRNELQFSIILHALSYKFVLTLRASEAGIPSCANFPTASEVGIPTARKSTPGARSRYTVGTVCQRQAPEGGIPTLFSTAYWHRNAQVIEIQTR